MGITRSNEGRGFFFPQKKGLSGGEGEGGGAMRCDVAMRQWGEVWGFFSKMLESCTPIFAMFFADKYFLFLSPGRGVIIISMSRQ